MEVGEGITDLARPVQDLVLKYEDLIATGLQHDRAQVLARDIIHYKIVAWAI